jgi:hypothetical protein
MARGRLLPVLLATAVAVLGLGWWFLREDAGRGDPAAVPSGVPGLVAEPGLPEVVSPGAAPGTEVRRVPFTPEEEGAALEHLAARSDSGRPRARVRGRVVDELGHPLASVEVAYGNQRTGVGAFPSEGLLRSAVRTDAQGRFLITDALLGHALRIAARPPELADAETVVEITSLEERELGDLVCRPGGAVSGLVRDAAQRPIAGAQVWAEPEAQAEENPFGRMRLARIGSSNGPRARTTTSDELGRFRLAGLRAGPHRILADDPFHLAGGSSVLQVAVGAEHRDVVIELQRGATLAGRVLDTADAPIQGARITARIALHDGSTFGDESRGVSVLSGEDGRFAFDGLAAASHRLTVTCPGFATSAGIAANPGEEPVIRLVRGGIVRGRVRDRSGSPREVERVRAFPAALGNMDRMVPAGRTLSGEAAAKELGMPEEPGLFAILDLQEGEIRIEASAAGCCPGFSDALSVTPGGTLDIEIVLDPECAIAGKVIDAHGAPVVGADVVVVEVSDAEPDWASSVESRSDRLVTRRRIRQGAQESTFSDASGRFRVGRLRPGSYRVRATHLGLGEAEGEATVGPDQPVAEIALAMPGTGRVAGRVLAFDGSPKPLAQLRISRTSTGAEDAFPRPVAADHLGRFEVLGLRPGTYRATLVRGPSSHMGFIMIDGLESQALPSVDFEIEAGRETEVILREPAAASLSGVVTEAGRPVAGAQVRVRPRGRTPFLLLSGTSSATTDEHGAFLFTDLQAGSYTVSARAGNSAFPAEADVTLLPGQRQEASLALSLGRIEGRVVSAGDGLPIGGARVEAVRARHSGEERSASTIAVALVAEAEPGGMPAVISIGGTPAGVATDPDGRFELAHVPAGDYQLRIEGGEAQTTITPAISVEEGQVCSVGSLTVLRGCTLEVSFDIEKGAPRPYFLRLEPETPGPGLDRHEPIQDGRPVRLSGLAPGGYTIHIHGDGPDYPRAEPVLVGSTGPNQVTIRIRKP